MNYSVAAAGDVSTLVHTRTRWLWRLALVSLLLVPLGLVCGTATVDIALSGVAIFFLLHVLFVQDWAWLKIRWVPLALLIWAYYIAISFQAIEPMVSLKGALGFIRFVMFGVACQYWLFKHAWVRRWMLYAVAATCLFAALDTWFQYFWGVDWFGVVARPGASLMSPIGPIDHFERLTALSGKMKIGGTIIVMAWPAVVFWLLQFNQPQRSMRYRLAVLTAAFLVLTIVPLTGERTSTLWMLLGSVCCYLWVPQTRKGLWCILLPIVLSVSLAFMVAPDFKERMLGSMPQIVSNAGMNAIDASHKSDNIYTALNRTALNLYAHHPWFGVGLKQFDVACRMAPDTINKMKPFRANGCNNSPQNMYLEFLVNTGTVGTVLFAALIMMWAWEIYNKRRHFSRCEFSRFEHDKDCRLVIANQPIILGVLIALCMRLFPFVTTTSFYFSWGAVIFWWMGAWLLAYCDTLNDQS